MRNRVLAAMAFDACCVLAFVVIGRASHAKGETLGGIASTSWPFLAGLAIGWLATVVWARERTRPGAARRRPGPGWRPAALAPAGLIAWLATVALGMTFRVISGQGTAVAFIGVALAFLGLFFLGWRILSRYIQVIRS
jgi:FtsH-binding integral membrane protein